MKNLRTLQFMCLIIFLFSINVFAQPYLGDLKAGDSFTLSKQTPLVDELNPIDPMEAISKMEYLPSGIEFSVLEVSYQNDDTNKNRPWYFVVVTKPSDISGKKGWINSKALYGQ